MYWLTGNFLVFLRLPGSLVELPWPQVEFADQVMLPMLLAIVVALTVAPLNRVASVVVEIVGFMVSCKVPVDEISKTLAKAF